VEGPSDFGLFRDGQGIVDLDAKITDRAFELGVAQKKLDRSQIPRPLVNKGCLGPAQRVGGSDHEANRGGPSAGNGGFWVERTFVSRAGKG